MSINRTECVERLILLPGKGNFTGKTAYDQLKKCGYIKLAADISKEDIARAVREHTDLIGDWYKVSSDKGDGAGWCFVSNGPGNYCVFFVPFSESTKDEIYTDESAACGAFIKHEIEAIRLRKK